VENFGDIFKNSIMRVLLVASFTNIGSLAGAYLGFVVIIHVTGIDPREIISSGISQDLLLLVL
jgi:hypothetical protein